MQRERWADHIKDVGDACDARMGPVAKARLQTDNLKWLLAKFEPKKYGDRVLTESTGDQRVLHLHAVAELGERQLK
jgi:hypothetical protein